MLWARSSTPAFKSGVFFRTANRAVPIPGDSITAEQSLGAQVSAEIAPGVWFLEGCREMTIFSEHYDFTITLLQLGRQTGQFQKDDSVDDPEDLGRLIRRNHGLDS
jgi:hypothetical protein